MISDLALNLKIFFMVFMLFMVKDFWPLLYRTGQLEDRHVHGQHDETDQQPHDNHERRFDGRGDDGQFGLDVNGAL